MKFSTSKTHENEYPVIFCEKSNIHFDYMKNGFFQEIFFLIVHI